jgi:hypothetical protein
LPRAALAGDCREMLMPAEVSLLDAMMETR